MTMKVKCNKCGYVGLENEFPKGRDFFQKSYVAACPKCDNRQNPGDASMRMFPSVDHPFTFCRQEVEGDALDKVLFNASEAA